MPLTYIGSVPGFAQRTFTEVFHTPFFPRTETGKWRSPVTQAGIRSDLMDFKNSTTRPKSASLDYAISSAYHAFHLDNRVKMLHLNDLFQQDLDIWSKSPGLPWREHGYKTKGDIKRDPDAINKVRLYWHRIKTGADIHPPDCLAFVRSHVCDYGESKIRAVWGYPATMTFGEGVFALPLIRAYQKREHPIAYGYETALGGMRKLYNKFTIGKNYAAIDFKSYDKTVPSWLIRVAFKILLANVDLVHYEEKGVADARRMHRMWNHIVDYFINTTIRTANGCRYRKSSGVASGSYFTQLIDSVCNYILCCWINIEQLGALPRDILVMGDDSIMITEGVLNLKDAQLLMQTIGMFINTEKSQITTELETIKFLGYSVGQGIPRKDHSSWMTALLFPETPDYCFDQLQSRALGLYYANMCVDMEFAHITAGLVKMKPFDLMLSRDMERKLKFIGISLDVLKTGNLPTPVEFARKMM